MENKFKELVHYLITLDAIKLNKVLFFIDLQSYLNKEKLFLVRKGYIRRRHGREHLIDREKYLFYSKCMGAVSDGGKYTLMNGTLAQGN